MRDVTTIAVYPSLVRSSAIPESRAIGTAANSTGPAPRGMPASISQCQRYYWSAKWQTDEAESLAEIEAGHAERFESGRSAVAWLLAAEDEEDDA